MWGGVLKPLLCGKYEATAVYLSTGSWETAGPAKGPKVTNLSSSTFKDH